MKVNFTIFALILLLFFQLIYSFFYPASGFDDNWLPIADYLPKFKAESLDNLFLEKLYPLISEEYRINSDVGNYLELAKDFGRDIFEGHIFTARPLYPFLIFLVSLPFRFFAPSSFGLVFGLAIFLNFILISAAVLLFFSLLKKIFPFRIAFLSSVFLIFSPSVHASLIQPLAEMLMIFVTVLTAYFLYDYYQKPSFNKLIFYSLIIGVFMLGKMFFAASFFILLLALYFKRCKEGIIFFAVHLIPLAFWYIWLTQFWKVPYLVNEVQNWNMVIWLKNIFYWPWHQTFAIVLSAVPNFIEALVNGFLLIPLIFSLLGFGVLRSKFKNILYFGAFFSLFAFLFLLNLYLPHHAFLLFPVIYPTAVIGIERVANDLKKSNEWFYQAFYIAIISLIIIISSINVYKVFVWL